MRSLFKERERKRRDEEAEQLRQLQEAMESEKRERKEEEKRRLAEEEERKRSYMFTSVIHIISMQSFPYALVVSAIRSSV